MKQWLCSRLRMSKAHIKVTFHRSHHGLEPWSGQNDFHLKTKLDLSSKSIPIQTAAKYNPVSLSFRYYYDKNILAKISGKRYAYKFDFHALTLACRAQQTPTPSDTKISDLSGILAPLLSTVQRASPATPTPSTSSLTATTSTTYRGRQTPETSSTRSATPRPESYASILDTSFSPSSCSVQSPIQESISTCSRITGTTSVASSTATTATTTSTFFPPSISEFDLWTQPDQQQQQHQQQQQQQQFDIFQHQTEDYQLPPYLPEQLESSIWSSARSDSLFDQEAGCNQFDMFQQSLTSSSVKTPTF